MGPLSNYRVIELSGLGPCPMAGMLLADMGAEVICVDRQPNSDPLYGKDMSRRGKKSIIIDLKNDQGRNTLLKLISTADVLIEGYRPGITEKLGIGPDVCLEHNPKLVYGRMTGWGQTGPLSHTAGHDINYISISGVLHAIGVDGEKPVVPLNIAGDFGGGAMFLLSGVLAALLEASKSGQGQVVDASMVEGSANLLWMCHAFHAVDGWDFSRRGNNILDGGAHFYDTYKTADNRYVAVGCIEPQFFNLLIEKTGLDPTSFCLETHLDKAQWPARKKLLKDIFLTKTRDRWCEIFDGTDACISPVLSAEEAPFHPQNIAREAYVEIDDYLQPAPAPRFSRTPSAVKHGLHKAGHDTDDVLQSIGLKTYEINDLKAKNAIT